jgi:GT2 family glycosyltransferase
MPGHDRSGVEAGTIALSPGLVWRVAARHPLRLLAIAWWALTGKRVRARNRWRDVLLLVLDPYHHWLGWVEPVTTSPEALRGLLGTIAHTPKIAVIALCGSDDAGWLVRVFADLQEQPYSNWEIVVPSQCIGAINVPSPGSRIRAVAATGEAGLLRCALAASDAQIVFPIDPGAVPARCALTQIAAGAPGCALIYGDEDRIDRAGSRCDPWFKPDWNEELAFAQDFLSGACAFDRHNALAVLPPGDDGRGAAVYEMAIRIARACPAAIGRLTHVISHRLSPRDGRHRLASVAHLVEPQGGQAVIAGDGRIAVDWPLPDPPPQVTLIVPTRDKADLLCACIGSVLERTDYPAYDIMVIDNGSVEVETRDCLDRLARDRRVSVVADKGPFNYAAINNRAAARARGDYLCLLNNDTVVLSPDWLTLMMRHAVRPGIGAVGAKLLYADHTIQHAGVAVGLGNAAGHSHRFQRDDDPGYHDLAHCTHYVSAVTGACLVVRKAHYVAAGGLDADHLAVAYNDVDLCLKLGQNGLRNVYEPRARLLHLESKSRGSDFSAHNNARYLRELAVFQARWDTTTVVDPVHHPMLDRSSETFRIRIQ